LGRAPRKGLRAIGLNARILESGESPLFLWLTESDGRLLLFWEQQLFQQKNQI